MDKQVKLTHNQAGAPTWTKVDKSIDPDLLSQKELYTAISSLMILEDIKHPMNTKEYLIKLADEERYPDLLRVRKSMMPSKPLDEKVRVPIGGDRYWCQE